MKQVYLLRQDLYKQQTASCLVCDAHALSLVKHMHAATNTGADKQEHTCMHAARPCYHRPALLTHSKHLKHVINMRSRLIAWILCRDVCQVKLSGAEITAQSCESFASKAWWICSGLIRPNTAGLMRVNGSCCRITANFITVREPEDDKAPDCICRDDVVDSFTTDHRNQNDGGGERESSQVAHDASQSLFLTLCPGSLISNHMLKRICTDSI